MPASGAGGSRYTPLRAEKVEVRIMTKRAVLVAAVMLACAAGASGQDPLRVAPEAYRLQFENG
jgi:hypothetical protein